MPNNEPQKPLTPEEQARRAQILNPKQAPRPYDAIEIPEQELSGSPIDKIPGLETEESREMEANPPAMRKFQEYYQRLNEASPEKLIEFVKFIEEQGLTEDPLIKDPALAETAKHEYKQIRDLALEKLGPRAIEALSQPKQTPVEAIEQKFIKASKQEDPKDKAFWLSMIQSDLDHLIRTYEQKLADPSSLLAAEKEKLQTELAQARNLQNELQNKL